jgi:hypothetical protein
LRAAFEIFAPQALCIFTAVQPASTALLAPCKTLPPVPRIGHNSGSVQTVWSTKVESWRGGNPIHWQDVHGAGDRPGYVDHKGCWPVRLGYTDKQNINPTPPKDPYVEYVLRKRVWTLGSGYGATEVGGIVTAALAEEVARMPNRRTVLREPYLDGGWIFEEERREGGRYLFEQHYVLPEARKRGIKVWSEDGLRRFLDAAIQRSKQEYKGRAREFFNEVCAAILKEEAEAEASRHALQPRQMTALGEPLRPAYAVTTERAAPARGYSVKKAVYEPEIARQIEEKRRAKGLGG